jgi:hypothetical protein
VEGATTEKVLPRIVLRVEDGLAVRGRVGIHDLEQTFVIKTRNFLLLRMYQPGWPQTAVCSRWIFVI